MSFNVFITGATGYIGGEVLYQLLTSTDFKFNVAVLVRNQAKADLLLKTTRNKVKPIIGNLDDLDIINQQVNENDIIINTANVDHVPSAKILAEALRKKHKPTILIHTSGTSVIGDDISESKGPTSKVYRDDVDINEINSLPLEQPHRPVDRLILEIQENNPKIDTVIISPSTIFGHSDGYDNVISQQIPNLIRLSVKNKQAFTVYSGNYIWNHIHIKDLGDLYYLILKKLINKEDIPKGKKGYYFGSYSISGEDAVTTEATEIEHLWSDVSKVIGEKLVKRGIISNPEVVNSTSDEIIKLKDGDKFAPFSWGTNSRSRGNNGYKIGWKPKYSGQKHFWDSIDEDIDYVVDYGLLNREIPPLV